MKLLVVGDAGVGKSTFIDRIADLCDDGVYRIRFSNQDASGHIELEVIENQLPQFELGRSDAGVIAVVYMFDVTDYQSFKKIKEMYDIVLYSYFPEYQMMLSKHKTISMIISSKVDLKNQREVPPEEVDRCLP